MQSGTGNKYGHGVMAAHQERKEENPTAILNIPTYTSTISHLTFDPNISSYEPNEKPDFDNYKEIMNKHIQTLEDDAVRNCNTKCDDPIYGCEYYTIKKHHVGSKTEAEKKVKRMEEELFFTDFGKWIATGKGNQNDEFTYNENRIKRSNDEYGYAPGSALRAKYPYEYKCFNIGTKPSGNADAKKHCVLGIDKETPTKPYTPTMCNEVSGNWSWCEKGNKRGCLTK